MNGDSQGRLGAGSTSSNWWMQMLFLPITVFMTTVDALGRMMGASQRAVGNVAGRGQPVASSVVPPVAPPQAASANSILGNTTNLSRKESNDMGGADQDLSGDDVKNVVYSILFTKRDLESTLRPETEELVNYATDGANFGAQKLLEFGFQTFARPAVWIDNDYPTPASGATLTLANLPAEDRKYVRFVFSVRDRFPKSEADYERRQTRALESINSKL